MHQNKKIEKQLEDDLGFEHCKVKEVQNKTGDEFEAKCQNAYEDAFSCQGKFNAERGSLSKTDCDKIE
jgi:hypothetical protein